MPEQGGHPIRVVSRRTGLSPEVLRIWEKRYGLVHPVRTQSGRRTYSDADIERLRLVRRATLAGRRVGEVSHLSIEDLRRLISEDEREAQRLMEKGGSQPDDAQSGSAREAAPKSAFDASRPGSSRIIVDKCMEAIFELDGPRLEATLHNALATMGTVDLMDGVIGPLMRTVGDLWEKGRLDVSAEHLASSVVRQTLIRMLAWSPGPAAAPLVVITTPTGQRHEVGAMLSAAVAQAEGWRVLYLGPDLPARDIARAVRQTGAAAVALSLIYPSEDPELASELSELRERLPKETKIIVGGSAAPSYRKILKRIGALVVPGITEFRGVMAGLRGAPASKT